MQVGNVTGKLIFGIACDKIGIWKTMCLAIACIIAASLCFILVPAACPFCMWPLCCTASISP